MQLVKDVKESMASMECKYCHHIPRKANQVAHYIAHGPNFISVNHDPTHVISFIERDVINSLISFHNISDFFSKKNNIA